MAEGSEGALQEGVGEGSTGSVSRDTTALTKEQAPEKEGTALTKEQAPEKEGKGEEDKSEEVTGAPEAYEDFKVPEGVKIDPDQLTEFGALAKGLNLTQDQAQQLVDFEAKRMEAFGKEQLGEWEKTIAGWTAEAKADEEIGGKNYDPSLELAKRALAKYGTLELDTAFNHLGIGEHPELIRIFARVGKDLGEDQILSGRDAGSGPKSQAERMYPNMNK